MQPWAARSVLLGSPTLQEVTVGSTHTYSLTDSCQPGAAVPQVHPKGSYGIRAKLNITLEHCIFAISCKANVEAGLGPRSGICLAHLAGSCTGQTLQVNAEANKVFL